MLLAGVEEFQGLAVDGFDPAVQPVAAGQFDPGVGRGEGGALGVGGELGVGVGVGLEVEVGVLVVLVHQHDLKVFLVAVGRRRFQEQVGPGVVAGAPQHQGPVLRVGRVQPPTGWPLVGLAVNGDLLDGRGAEVHQADLKVADAVLLGLNFGDLDRQGRAGGRGESVVGRGLGGVFRVGLGLWGFVGLRCWLLVGLGGGFLVNLRRGLLLRLGVGLLLGLGVGVRAGEVEVGLAEELAGGLRGGALKGDAFDLAERDAGLFLGRGRGVARRGGGRGVGRRRRGGLGLESPDLEGLGADADLTPDFRRGDLGGLHGRGGGRRRRRRCWRRRCWRSGSRSGVGRGGRGWRGLGWAAEDQDAGVDGRGLGVDHRA